jgi:hypothetical protein
LINHGRDKSIRSLQKKKADKKTHLLKILVDNVLTMSAAARP